MLVVTICLDTGYYDSIAITDCFATIVYVYLVCTVQVRDTPSGWQRLKPLPTAGRTLLYQFLVTIGRNNRMLVGITGPSVTVTCTSSATLDAPELSVTMSWNVSSVGWLGATNVG